jgi:toxin-antitoxin system PIN domain toxin
LLDANVLLALAWPNHLFHSAATRRMVGSRDRWATCAVTQLAFIRISCVTAVVPSRKTPAEATAILSMMMADSLHVYLDSLPPPAEVWMQRAHGTKQVTDAYLLALAERHRATFLTFDAKLRALAGSRAKTEVLAG